MQIIEKFIMVRMQGNQGRGDSSQGTPPWRTPLSSLELAVILCSLVVNNEIIRGHQATEGEVEHLPLGVGNPEGSRNSIRLSPTKDITRELQNINLLEFAWNHTNEQVEA